MILVYLRKKSSFRERTYYSMRLVKLFYNVEIMMILKYVKGLHSQIIAKDALSKSDAKMMQFSIGLDKFGYS